MVSAITAVAATNSHHDHNEHYKIKTKRHAMNLKQKGEMGEGDQIKENSNKRIDKIAAEHPNEIRCRRHTFCPNLSTTTTTTKSAGDCSLAETKKQPEKCSSSA